MSALESAVAARRPRTSGPTFASLLDETDPRAIEALRRLALQALIPLILVAALLALWAFTAPLSGAVVAEGRLKAELNRKTVQHQEGGIVREILVRDGQFVRSRQPLLVIGDVHNDAELSLLQDQLSAERVRRARAEAEAALSPMFEPPSAAASSAAATTAMAAAVDSAAHFAREKALFDARRRTLDQQVAAFEAQIHDAQAQADALTRQISATETSGKLAGEELALNEKLAREGFVQRARLLQLQRDATDYRSRLSESQGDLALARQHKGELQARLVQARNQYQQQAADEARESAARIREIEERLRPSRDQAERQIVRAPVDGKVMALRVSSVGEAVGPRDPLLDIVPTREKLVVEARIRPQDVNNVREGATAEVRFTSFDARTTPLLAGTLVFVSPDLMTSPDGTQSWFVATVEVDAAALTGHPEIRLHAGMPAELFVTTPERTLFDYLAKPFTAFAHRAMREP